MLPVIEKQLQSMYLRPTNEHEVTKIFHQLKNKTSTGPYGVSNKMVKLASSAIIPPITKLITRCFVDEQFPSSLKIAKVIPIYKDGESNLFENYRPISLLPPIAKVIERIIYNRMNEYIEKFDLLSANHFGFRKKHRTVDSIARVIEDIRESLDKKVPSCCVFFDLRKAFDTIDHSILLQKLENYGFRGPIYNLLKSYLDGRLQYPGDQAKPVQNECRVHAA